MGKVHDAIDDALTAWMLAQPMFFVATAPLSATGHVNVSPKGGRGSFQVLGPRRVAYLDIAGSGAETIAHVRENGRVVVMFCAFDGKPRIVRLHGRATVHPRGGAAFAELAARFPAPGLNLVAARSILDVAVGRIAESCGYSVPLMSFEGTRPHQDRWVDKRLKQHGPDGIRDYVRARNAESLDGLPALDEPSW